jgi:polar amino acid transport system substrate-binding protein
VQLRTGRAVAVLNDLPPAAYLATGPRTKAHYQLATTTQYEPGLYGVVVAKDQPGLRDAVQGACEELLRSGAYREDLARWGVRAGAVTRISIDSDR